MDHMSTKFNKFVGTACLSIFLQIGINAQIAPTSALSQNSLQDKAAQSNSSSETSSSNSNPNKVALASEAASKAKSDVSTEPIAEALIPAPKVTLQNGTLNLKVAAREAKMDARLFEMSDPDELGEPMTFQATAYALKGRTRSGAYVRRGVIAADPRVLPLGSVVQIKAGKYTGVYTVHDTGGKIKGNIIDVWMPTNQEARQFGRRKIKLHVLKLGAKGKSRKK